MPSSAGASICIIPPSISGPNGLAPGPPGAPGSPDSSSPGSGPASRITCPSVVASASSTGRSASRWSAAQPWGPSVRSGATNVAPRSVSATTCVCARAAPRARARRADALRPVLEALATTLGQVMRESGPEPGELESGEPGAPGGPGASPFGPEMLGGMMQMLAPALLGMQAGSMIGYLAQHALGRYDLPLPTSDEPSLCFIVQNIDAFEEAWSLERADLRL